MTELDDLGLTEGTFYYYSIFVLAEDEGGTTFSWRRAADATGLVAMNYGSTDLMLERIPSVYTTYDQETGGKPDSGTTLAKFISVFGWDFDIMRTQHESLRYVNDPDRAAGGLVPVLSEQWGLPYEPEVGIRQTRILLRNITTIRKRKGTAVAAEALATSFTGWAADSALGRNLMLDTDDSSFELSVGRWLAVANCTVARTAGDTYVAPDFTNLQGGKLVVSCTGGTATVRLLQGRSAVLYGIPVTGGEAYTASAYTRAGQVQVRTCTIGIEWYDSLGVAISTETDTGAANVNAAWTTRIATRAEAPANAAYAGLILTITTPSAGEAHWFDAIQFELAPDRVNRMTDNMASMETSVADYGSNGNALLAQSATVAFAGTQSLRMTTAAIGTMSIYFPHPTSSFLPATPGETYTCVAHIRAGTTARQCRMDVSYFDAGGVLVPSSFTSGETTTNSTTYWTQLTATSVAPPLAVGARAVLRVIDAAMPAGEQHYVDGVSWFLDPAGDIAGAANFEVDALGWTLYGSATIARSTLQAYAGPASLEATCTSTVGSWGARSGATRLIPDKTYLLAARVFNPTGSTISSLSVSTEGTYGGATLDTGKSGTNAASATTTVKGAWTTIYCHVTPVAGDVSGSIIIVGPTGTAVGQKFYIGGVQVIEGAMTPPAFMPVNTINHFTNPSLETNTTQWGASGAGPPVLSRDTATMPRYGTASLKVVTDGTGSLQGAYTFTAVQYAAGTRMKSSIWIKGVPGVSMTIWLRSYTGALGGVVDVEGTSTVVALTGEWQRITPAPVVNTVTGVFAIFARTTGTVATTFYLDGAQLEQGDTATSYFDGTLGGTNHFWVGAAHASTPVRMTYPWALALAAAPLAFQEARDLRMTLSADRVNEVPNPSAEVDLAGWYTGNANTTLARSTGRAYSGDTAVITPTATQLASFMASATATGDVILEAPVTTVRANTPYTLSAYAHNNNSKNAQVALVWLDSNGVSLGTSTGTAAATNATGWTRVSVSTISPANTASCIVRLIGVAITAANPIYFDGVLLEDGITLQGYFDALSDPEHAGDYLWQGTAHASRSHYYYGRPVKSARLRLTMPDYLWPGTPVSLLYAQAG